MPAALFGAPTMGVGVMKAGTASAAVFQLPKRRLVECHRPWRSKPHRRLPVANTQIDTKATKSSVHSRPR